jgi:hypothetical protein
MISGTHIITILMFIVALGSGVTSWWITSTRAESEKPVLALNGLIRDLRGFHGLAGGFPADLHYLQDKVWLPQGRGGFQLSEENHSYVSANYYYLYAPVGPHEARLWAIPLGKYRSQFSTYYVKVLHTSSVPEIWQGPALYYDQVKKIKPLMEDAELINLGLVLQASPAQAAPALPAPGQTAPAQNPAATPRPPSDSPFRFKTN